MSKTRRTQTPKRRSEFYSYVTEQGTYTSKTRRATAHTATVRPNKREDW